MSFSPFNLALPLLHSLDPERAHGLTIQALKAGLHPRQERPDPESLRVGAFGLEFPNPLGMAAGFDKNGEVPDALLAQGFGFVEIGTVTPKPQAGNPRPRVFRLPQDGGAINRLGFNNQGHATVLRRLRARSGGGIIGVNVGANKDSSDRISDYVKGIGAFAPVASYLTVNISSPNTPGLRDLQERAALDDLLKQVLAARDAAVGGAAPRRPVLLKIAPDLDDKGLADVVEVAMKRGIDGMIVSNTTISRPPLNHAALAGEPGGLSGRPLFELSTRCLARVWRLTGGELPLIGVGGVDSGRAAFEKIRAGASLVQLYTCLIYGGAGMISDIKSELAAAMAEAGYGTIAAAVGTGARDWETQGSERT